VVETRKATTADIAAVSTTLARAFHDDPVMNFLIKNENRLRRFFAAELRHQAIPNGETWTTPDHLGAAIWAPPKKWRTTNRQMIRMLPATAPCLGARIPRGLRVLGVVEKKHPKEPHYYLATLGTHCDHQGKGVGSALIAPVLDRCDREGIPAYLESSKVENVPFYRRHGFEVTEEVQLPGGGPTLWLMWRNPKPA
jgi:ribosomal protein S18 acetylase RimI-like enzyme